MEKKFKLGVIGAGFMSYSIVKGVLNSSFLSPKSVLVSDINADSLKKFIDLGVKVTTDNGEITDNSEFVLLAVKPQNFSDAVKNVVFTDNNKIISIMAGVKKSSIKRIIDNPSIKIARCMPNAPCSVGCGAVGIDITDFTEDNDVTFIKGLFLSFSELATVTEDKLNAVTGISGSSPAYFYLFIKHLIEAGVKNGLDPADAKKLAVKTMIGSGKILLENDTVPIDDLISSVCSKGGTTIEAINHFNDSDFKDVIIEAVDKCIKKADVLEKNI